MRIVVLVSGIVVLVSGEVAGAVSAPRRCGDTSPRIRPKCGPFSKRTSANIPEAQGTAKRNAFFQHSSIFPFLVSESPRNKV